ncbi:MAG: four helix bundle protein, partial [Candidatus Peribacteraceae bacterium]|nr:four helix bundle protein [Candidatus Peribacteraceae bacterium]
EAYETRYWLFLLRDSNNLDEKFTQQSLQSVDEIIRMLVSSIKTAKRNL